MASNRNIRAEDLKALLNDGFLGSGGFGSVHLCIHDALGMVAVKCCPIRGSKKQIEQCQANVERELKALMNANHPNVVSVYGVTQWKRNIGIVMEHLVGGSLCDLIIDRHVKSIPVLVCVRLVYELCNGLSYLHNLTAEVRMVHGDIKPQNCLLTDDLHLKISDFGGARISTHTGYTMIARMHSDPAAHTPSYCAPERLKNPRQSPTTSMDVYSAGLTILVLLTRRQKFLDNIADLAPVMKKIHARFPDDPTGNVAVLVDIARASISHEPHDRPAVASTRNKLHNVLAAANPADVAEQSIQVIRTLKIKLPPNDSVCQALASMTIDDSGEMKAEASRRSEDEAVAGEKRNGEPSANCRLVPSQPSSSNVLPRAPCPIEVNSASSAGDKRRQEATTSSKFVSIRPTSSSPSLLSTKPEDSITSGQLEVEDIFSPSSAAGLNEELKRARDLVPQYESAGHANQAEKCDEIVELLTMILLNNTATDSDKLLEFAEKQLEAENFTLAVLSCRASANLFEHSNSRNAATGIANCCITIQDTANAMLQKKTTDSHQLAKSHLIPVIASLRDKIGGLKNVDDKQLASREATCTNCVAHVLLLLGEYHNAEEECNLGLQLLESNLPVSTCAQYQVHGRLLHNLAVSHRRREQFEAAAKFYSQALTAKKLAVDYLSESEKKESIELTERWLKMAMDRP